MALAKCLLLLLGVPAALVRLWLLDPVPGGLLDRQLWSQPAGWLHVLLVVLAGCWCWASATLLADLARVLRHREAASPSWSGRWAVRAVGLTLALSAGSAALAGPPRGTGAPPVVASAPAAVRSAREVLPAGSRGRAASAPGGPGPTRSPGGQLAREVQQLQGRSQVGGPTRSAAPARQVRPTDRPGSERARRPDPPRGGSRADLRAEACLAGLGLIGGAALARRVGLLRRLGECLRRPGERARRPALGTGLAEALLGPLAECDRVDWIEAANRLLWRSLREEGRGQPGQPPLPDVRLVRAGPEGLELLLAPGAEHPADGFVAAAGGRTWLLDPELDLDTLEALTAGCGRYLPGLLPIGEAGEASYLLPLGPGRHLVLEGSEEAVEPVLSALLLALRTLPWAEETAVELVGQPPPSPAEHCYQMSASSLGELAQLAGEQQPVRPEQRLRATWARQTLVAVDHRLEAAQEDLLERVLPVAGALSLGGRGTDRLLLDAKGALLVPGGLEAFPGGIEVSVPRPSADQLALAERLLAEAARPPEPLPDEGGPRRLAELDPGSGDGPGSGPQGIEPAGPVEVRLLAGSPRVVGLVAPPSSRDAGRVVEMVAYLALHGYEASPEQLRQAVFARAGTSGSPGRVANVGASARAALGRSGSGRPYLPAPLEGPYRLDRAVTCDWTRLSRAVTRARGAAPGAAGLLLREALELVEGVPVAGRHPGWAWFAAEGLARELTSEVVDAAHHLACLALAGGDTTLARWAVARGRALEPASELLVRDLLAACEADGDEEGLERAYADLERALESLGGHEPSPETRALFEELTAGRRSEPHR